MVGSLVLLVAAIARISGAIRFHPLVSAHGVAPHTISGYPLHGPVTRTLERPSSLQMQIGTQLPESWKPRALAVQFWREAMSDEYGSPVLADQFPKEGVPPTTLGSIDTRQVLSTWERAVSDQGYNASIYNASRVSMGLDQQLIRKNIRRRKDWLDFIGWMQLMEYTLVLQEMIHDIAGLSPNTHTQAVGLISNDLETAVHGVETPFYVSEFDASVQALAVFSQEEVKDDSKGSLRKMAEAQFEIKAARGSYDFELQAFDNRVSVFAIHGVAQAPNLPAYSDSARVLLAKIAQWAQIEQKLVVVSKHALHSSDGTALTQYYQRLGFKKVEMEDGSYEFVLPLPVTSGLDPSKPSGLYRARGRKSGSKLVQEYEVRQRSDQGAVNWGWGIHQFMVGLNLWSPGTGGDQ